MKKFNNFELSLAQLIKQDSTTVCDEAFERPKGCWVSSQELAFLRSLFGGYMCSPICRANVDSCRRYSILSNDQKSRQYFDNRTAENAQWVSLDGKHRRETIRKFFNNEISYTGDVILADGEIEQYRNCYYKDMTNAAQAALQSLSVLIVEFTSATRKELPIIFKGINSGALPTPQHLRNASDSPLAQRTRNMHKNFHSLFDSFYSKTQVAKMTPEETISKMLIHLSSKNEVSINTKVIDNFYAKGEEVGVDGEYGLIYDLEATSLLKTILTYMSNISSNPSSKVNNKNSILFFLVIESLIKDNYEIVDENMFYSKVLKLNSDLDRQSRKEILELEEAGVEFDSLDFYSHWIRQKWSNTYRYMRQQALWEVISENPSDYGLSVVGEELSEEAA